MKKTFGASFVSLVLMGSLAALSAFASDTPKSGPINLTEICRTPDGKTVLEIFPEDVFPTRISLVVNSILLQQPLSYLVKDLTGTYDNKNRATIFSFQVDGNEIDVTLPDAATDQATITSPGSSVVYKLTCQ